MMYLLSMQLRSRFTSMHLDERYFRISQICSRKDSICWMDEQRWIKWSPCGHYVIMFEYGQRSTARLIAYEVYEKQDRKKHARKTSEIAGTWTSQQKCVHIIRPQSDDLGTLTAHLCEIQIRDGDVTIWNGQVFVGVFLESQLVNRSIYEIGIWKPHFEEPTTFIERMKSLLFFKKEKEFCHLQNEMLRNIVPNEMRHLELCQLRFAPDGQYAGLIMGSGKMAVVENPCGENPVWKRVSGTLENEQYYGLAVSPDSEILCMLAPVESTGIELIHRADFSAAEIQVRKENRHETHSDLQFVKFSQSINKAANEPAILIAITVLGSCNCYRISCKQPSLIDCEHIRSIKCGPEMLLLNMEEEFCFQVLFLPLLETTEQPPKLRIKILHCWRGDEDIEEPDKLESKCKEFKVADELFCRARKEFPIQIRLEQGFPSFHANPLHTVIAMLTRKERGGSQLMLADSRRMCATQHVYSLQMIVRHLLCSQHPELNERLKAQKRVPGGLMQLLTLQSRIL